MKKHTLIIPALMVMVACSAHAQDETPNIEPGEWALTTVITMEGPFPIPTQEDTTNECITQEEIDEGMAFMNDDETCEINEKVIQRDSAKIIMTCNTGEEVQMNMEMEMEYSGDSMTGAMVGNMQTPMGAMKMNLDMSGERLGDC